MSATTHYDVLGVRAEASANEIREAFRRRAREHHPDRTANAARSAQRMAEINEAYRVLSDPGRRANYDATLRRASATSSARAATSEHASTSPIDEPLITGHHEPVRVPWRMLLLVGLIGVIGVIVLAQFTEPGQPDGPDGILRVGDCVEIEADNDAREVQCTSDPSRDRVVRVLIPFDATCPGMTSAHRDAQGMGIACVEAAVGSSGTDDDGSS